MTDCISKIEILLIGIVLGAVIFCVTLRIVEGNMERNNCRKNCPDGISLVEDGKCYCGVEYKEKE